MLKSISIYSCNPITTITTTPIRNHVGHMYALGSAPSYITSKSFEESCDPAVSLADGAYYHNYHDGSCTSHSTIVRGITNSLFNTSDKARIFVVGDLYLNISLTPVIRGSDIRSGASIICSDPALGSIRFSLVQFHTLLCGIAKSKTLMTKLNVCAYEFLNRTSRYFVFDLTFLN